ncbi:MAG TPA: carboxypeptidase-like regulatory domain-containing protein, partial [Thermoplasmata archaeon]|nr:carboxypeptidase-like regulatory domain-containing protein [Thermoplasmata archaeon]
YVKFRPVDSRGIPVDAFVSASNSSTSRLYAAGLAAAGESELRLPVGASRVRAHWLTAQVYDTIHPISGDDTLTLNATVFYATLQVQDSRQQGLEGAEVRAAQDAGEVRAEGTTDDGGNVTLRLPAVNYTLRALWKGVQVLQESLSVTSDSSGALHAKVYYIDVVTKDANGAMLSPVYLRAADAGEVRDTGYTADGKFSLRLPASNYTVRARFAASYYLTDVSWEEQKSVDLRADAMVEFVVTKYPVQFYMTIAFWAGFVAAILILLIIFLLSRLRGAPPMFLGFLSKKAKKIEESERREEALVSGPEGAEVPEKDVERDEGPAVEPTTVVEKDERPDGPDDPEGSAGDPAARERSDAEEVGGTSGAPETKEGGK